MDKAILVFYVGSTSIGFPVFTLWKGEPSGIDVTASIITAGIHDRSMLCIVVF